ncbi:YgiQ family radical SAM protein, partial [Bacteroides thetaiotaomicron]
MEQTNTKFLPVSKADMAERGWEEYDFLLITGDAYVDHPSFGSAIISRLLEHEGYRVAVLAQPDWRRPQSFTALGRPRLGVLISSGNIDSMVAHYTVAKKRRHDDAYSPGNRAGLRPDHAVVVYANRVREVFRDYWDDKVRRGVLFDSQADLLVYGMGERATKEIAARLASGTPVSDIRDVKGTAYIAKGPAECVYPKVEVASYEAVCADKRSYAEANMAEYREHDPIVGRAILQRHGGDLLVVNPPAMPLTTAELDAVAELPYVREPHPMYDALGGVPAIEEV